MSFDLRLLLVILLPGWARPQLPDRVARHMASNVDPCLDFYRYACGKWAAVHAGMGYRSVVGQLDFNYHNDLADVLEQPLISGQEEPGFVRLVRDYYAACRVNQTVVRAMEVLGWIIRKREASRADLTVGVNAAFRLHILLDLHSADMQKVWVDLIVRYDVDWDEKETRREAMTREEFDRLWKQFPAAELEDKESFWSSVTTLEKELLDAGQGEAFNILKGPPAYWMFPWPARNPDVWHFKQMVLVLSYCPIQFLLRYIYLRLSLIPSPESIQPWAIERNDCAQQAREFLGHPAVWLMEQHHPRLQEEPVLQGLFGELKQRFGQKLRANRNEFSAKVQAFLLAKLDRMHLRLSVLPQRGDKVSTIAERYRFIKLNASDHFGNLEHLLTIYGMAAALPYSISPRFEMRKWWLPIDRRNYGSFASPFFLPRANMLVVPLSLLASPLYERNQSDLLTYSSLGFILGHELTHGFGFHEVGRSPRGHLHPGVIKELRRNKSFRRAEECVEDRFGPKYSEEKLADAMGLELAYSAYFHEAETDRKRNRTGSQSPQQRQLFFLNMAQFFCSDERWWDHSSRHGSDRRRVNDAVKMFPPFLEAFGCPASPRASRKPCRLY
ncbi:endothelin-converting enzyme-like 1 [Drosophila bipectinata]|uniref:endothelin-converting enzyme-like 1 n=1 Tax=Drosophila bipectinata TaxID=42026 RepID=UPI001C897F58|nr:endothelin-converting enzyme-like 1 [Drosophila bipectinata]